ncbi:MAG: membrane protein insertase YidC [Candidatus Moranbacteria bacterium]|nr:membrane protein insertase YidC [Candidatus Moranbacteria bacterium]
MGFYNTVIYQPIYNLLIFLYSILGSDLGLAIIALTVIIKLIFIPLSKKQIESQKELQKVQPKIKELQAKYKDDKETQSKEMMKLYKEHKINPAAGCLPLIIQMVVFITMYKIINKLTENFQVDLSSLYNFISHPESVGKMFMGFLNLSTPSIPLAIVTAGLQYYQIKMMQQKNAKTKVVTEPKKDGTPDIATIMSKQMLIVIPMMTLFIGATFPSGLALYWFTSTLFIIVQQWIVMHKEAEKENNK